MTIETNVKFNPAPLPVRDDGMVALVLLSESSMSAKGLEYYGQPVVVSRWSGKLKTTINPIRLDYGDVVGWMELYEQPST